MGVFAEWQPRYAEAGIATFPVDPAKKKPLVGNYLKAGKRASQEWATKFGNCDAMGFAAGAGSNLTIVDIDASGDNLVADVMARFGHTNLVARTPSGGSHLYYRHSGENRNIRADSFDFPVDILGRGMAVAPPTLSAKGQYQWIAGSLADLRSLPPINDNARGIASSANVATDLIQPGQRNDTLFKTCLAVAAHCRTIEELRHLAARENFSRFSESLSDTEVDRVVASAWKIHSEGRNGRAGNTYFPMFNQDSQVLVRHPDALAMYHMLRSTHWGRDFCIANDWHKTIGEDGWSLARLKSARKFLLDHGFVICVRQEAKGRAALYRFKPPVVLSGGRQGDRV